MKRKILHQVAVWTMILLATGLCQGARGGRYALILEEAPLAALDKPGAKERAARSASHESLARQLRERGITVTGATATVLHAVYVAGISPEEAAGLRGMAGVARVVEMEPVKRHLVKATELVNATQAWSAIGGSGNAGTGVKIGILDTGIDQAHPAFQDAALRPPTGYPRCREADCAFTNSKVIVARSYVDLLVLGEQPEFSRPDDLSARDRVGHGTATAMVAAGARHESPLGAMSGIAPKAFLGNYKVFGSPGVNDVTFDDVIIRALDDAVNDGMDIAVLSLGRAALWSPDDRGTVCQLAADRACDPRADAVENAIRRGLTVVVSAGNDGDFAVYAPALNSVHSPGTAPSAITVGASTNAQRYYYSVRMTGAAVPEPLRQIPALFGDGPRLTTVLTAAIRDVAAMQEDGRACSPLTNGSLTGAIALVQRGNCSFIAKVQNAQRAGAVGVVIQQQDGTDFLFPPTGLGETGIPAMMIGNTGGKALQEFLRTNPDRAASMDPAVITVAQAADLVAFFSTHGPSIGGGAIKPELVAVGQEIYAATQRFDPNGDMYHPTGFTAVQGTSFSAPMAAGAAALFKQRFPVATPAQVKSAVVNTAVNTVNDESSGQTLRASVLAVGAGKLDAAGPARTTVTVEPATLSFGILAAGALPSRGFRVNNHGNASANVQLQVRPLRTDPNARVVLSESGFALAAGTARQITARLEGTLSQPGVYEGDVLITGGAVPVRIPFLYLVGDNATDNAIPLRGSDFVGEVNGTLRLALKLVDRFGVPVASVPVRFRSTVGGGSIDTGTQSTDSLGIAEATVVLGPTIGEQEFSAEAGGLTLYFSGRNRLAPVIQTGGVVNAASGQVGRGVAPGSYVSIFGRNLSEALRVTGTASLPLSLAGVSVSFDVPERRLSLPGRLHFVSETQINVQVPWELQGVNTVQMKVSIGDSSSALYDVPLNDYSPALFEYTDAATGRLVAAALDQGFRLVSPANPVRRGQFVQLYANGLGPVDDRPETGEPTAAEPLPRTRVLPTVTIGGRPAEVIFSGLAPGNVGLYQMNVQVPADAAAGIQPVEVTVNGISSKTSNLPID
ncbi:MAG: S8 family serine peptidase [Acidobacteriia bacterium]|nr:S8 family serine peptidase [Terriglobia bacterium]